ncbi:hypothetical protein HFO56_34125 [Rhizobium laguerreae]|uniref:hypothetical protein n=1 Tax=Rhizobium laguerreae TaxID=1076926 RepID=UPI001C9018EF|nr:hypothetical protein [Rhizobium laguerreae]MBY3157365.1 hypothetical protein [Rhizobium laguerreae]
MEDAVIRWLDQANYELAEYLGAKEAAWPEYLKSGFDSRVGRVGGGRLWVALEIDFTGIEWKEDRAYDVIGKDYGGIVVRKSDAHHVLAWPGVVTDIHVTAPGAEGPGFPSIDGHGRRQGEGVCH